MRLYHGTNVDFEIIDLSKSKPNKDFGPGFYLSDDQSQAQAMAEIKTKQSGGFPIVHEYEFDYDALLTGSIKTLVFDNYSKSWADFIIANRDKKQTEKVHEYDFVYGPIADDKIGLQVQLYLQSLIEIDTLLDRIKYHKITYQYYFGTDKALKFLKRV